MLPWEFAAELRIEEVGLPRALIHCVADRQFWYVFAWLLPLGAIRFLRLPGSWVYASISGAAAALAMCAWNDGGGTAAYTIFHAIGPALSLSAAQMFSPGSTPAPNRAASGATFTG
jgi:hypothetical protein